MVGEVVGPPEAFGAGLAAVLAQVHLLVLTQAVLPAELHPALNALEQLKSVGIKVCFTIGQVHHLVLTQAILPAELHPALNALEQLKQ